MQCLSYLSHFWHVAINCSGYFVAFILLSTFIDVDGIVAPGHWLERTCSTLVQLVGSNKIFLVTIMEYRPEHYFRDRLLGRCSSMPSSLCKFAPLSAFVFLRSRFIECFWLGPDSR